MMLSKCQICLEDSHRSVVTSCGHIYCSECLNKWMATSGESSQRCPICKRQLKKEEFQELTSGVCSICQMKPKLPVLTQSGSLSCWACVYKAECTPVIPIYGTDTESEGNPDPAVPPRPILQSIGRQSTYSLQIEDENRPAARPAAIEVNTTTVSSGASNGQSIGVVWIILVFICIIAVLFVILTKKQ